MNRSRSEFQYAVETAEKEEDVFAALYKLAKAVINPKLFTVTIIELDLGVAQRVYSSDPENYSISGTKPIVQNDWFRRVHGQHETFVANTIDAIATHFFDFELIDSLGCQSVVNLPVVVRGEVVATINFLHEKGYFTPERVLKIQQEMSLPAVTALLLNKLNVIRES